MLDTAVSGCTYIIRLIILRQIVRKIPASKHTTSSSQKGSSAVALLVAAATGNELARRFPRNCDMENSLKRNLLIKGYIGGLTSSRLVAHHTEMNLDRHQLQACHLQSLEVNEFIGITFDTVICCLPMFFLVAR